MTVWSNNYPSSLTTTTEMPTVADGVDPIDATQFNSLRDLAIAIENEVGSDVIEAGSIRDKLAVIESSIAGARPFEVGDLYLSTTNPTGVTATPEVVYQFDGSLNSLNDRTANAHNLSVAEGTLRHAALRGRVGVLFDGNLRLEAPLSAALQITGALTVEMIIAPVEFSTGSHTIIECARDGELETQNIMYAILHNNDAATASQTILPCRYLHEQNAGSNIDVTFANSGLQKNVATYVALTRDSGGSVVNLYQDAFLSGTNTDDNPTGGSLSQLSIGKAHGAALAFRGYVFSVRITPEEFTPAQVAESWSNLRKF